MQAVKKTSASVLSKKIRKIIETNSKLRSQIISIGIPILMPDGKILLRTNEIKIPAHQGDNEIPINKKNINLWAHDGWVDLRVENMKRWKTRFDKIFRQVNSIPKTDTSSRFIHTSKYWDNFGEIDPGKLAGWIFNYEEKGMRMKA